MSQTELRARFDQLKTRTGPLTDAELDDFWAVLPPATIADLLGHWHGGEFVTGHHANGLLAKARWHGKTFASATDAKPLICLDEAGDKFSNTELMNGEASLWVEEFRGEMVATMVYDGAPIHDHFKLVDADTVLGIMNGKSALIGDRHLYFWLERE